MFLGWILKLNKAHRECVIGANVCRMCLSSAVIWALERWSNLWRKLIYINRAGPCLHCCNNDMPGLFSFIRPIIIHSIYVSVPSTTEEFRVGEHPDRRAEICSCAYFLCFSACFLLCHDNLGIYLFLLKRDIVPLEDNIQHHRDIIQCQAAIQEFSLRNVQIEGQNWMCGVFRDSSQWTQSIQGEFLFCPWKVLWDIKASACFSLTHFPWLIKIIMTTQKTCYTKISLKH